MTNYLTYYYEIIESDISVDEDFIAVIWTQDQVDGPRTVFDIRTGNSKDSLKRWATNTLNSLMVAVA